MSTMPMDGIKRPPIIHQPCGKETVRQVVYGGNGLPSYEYQKCDTCNVTLKWPNVDLQYQQGTVESEKPAANLILITVQTWYEDAPNPLLVEFPMSFASARDAEVTSNQLVNTLRKYLENK